MPIDQSEWNAGITPEAMEARILKFLQGNKGNAYTSEEIGQALGELTKSLPKWDRQNFFKGAFNYIFMSWRIKDELEVLIKQGKVQSRSVKIRQGIETYYKVI